MQLPGCKGVKFPSGGVFIGTNIKNGREAVLLQHFANYANAIIKVNQIYRRIATCYLYPARQKTPGMPAAPGQTGHAQYGNAKPALLLPQLLYRTQRPAGGSCGCTKGGIFFCNQPA